MRSLTRAIIISVIAALLILGASLMPSAQIFNNPRTVACGNASQPAELADALRQAASLSANFAVRDQLKEELSSIFGESLFDSQLYSAPRSLSLSELRNLDDLIVQKITELETIGTGPNRECREIAGMPALSDPVLYSLLINELEFELMSPLAKLYLFLNLTRALIVIQATSAETPNGFRAALSEELLAQTRILAATVPEAPTYEIALSRASVVFTPLFMALSFADDESLTLTVLNPDLWKSLACGEEIEIPRFNLKLNGSTSVTQNTTTRYPLRQAGAELWAFTSTLLNIILILFNPQYGESYLDQALNGCTPELRQHAANLYISLNPEIAHDADRLEALVMESQSEELRWAAAASLAPLLARDVSLTDAYLQGIALRSSSEPLRSAAGHALGLRWMRAVNNGELDYTATFQFPPNGGVTQTSGTLTQFALSHAGVHPELAKAAILPLFMAHRMVTGGP